MNRWVQTIASFLAFVFARIYLRLRVRDYDRLPATGGVIVIANHASHLDPPLLGAIIKRDKWFLARKSLGKFRLGQFLLEKLGVIFVDRDAPSRSSMQAAIDRVASGGLLIMFPEGTRSEDGTVGEFRRGVELIVRRSKQAAILPVGLIGTAAAFPRGAILPRPRRCEVRFGEPISVSDLKAIGGIEALRSRVADLAGAPLAALETESNSSEVVDRMVETSDPLRGPDGPAAAEGVRRSS